MLGIVLTSYHHQFKENIWKIFVWCMNTLSVGLGLLEVAQYDVFNSFVCTYYNEIENTVIADPNVEDADKLRLRADIMAIVHNMTKDASDDQIKFVTSKLHL
jgi:uncharacterized protein YcgI (DUF1989 family)